MQHLTNLKAQRRLKGELQRLVEKSKNRVAERPEVIFLKGQFDPGCEFLVGKNCQQNNAKN